MIGSFLMLLMYSNCTPLKPLPQATRYANQVSPGHKLIATGANYIIEKSADNQYISKRFYYETGRKTSEQTFSDPNLRELHGPYKQWLDNGKPWLEGSFQNDKKTGIWKEYTYVGDKQGKLSTGPYVDGLKHGTWTHYDSVGQISRRLNFENGELISSQTLQPDGSFTADTLHNDTNTPQIQIEPSFPCSKKWAQPNLNCGEKSLMDYLSTQIKYPKSALKSNISGTAYIVFVVNKTGEVQDVKVLQGLCDEIKAECYRVVTNMPNWTPGSANGKPVKVLYTLPIKFKVE